MRETFLSWMRRRVIAGCRDRWVKSLSGDIPGLKASHARPGQLARRILLDGLRESGFELAPSNEFGDKNEDF